ncbi:MAG: hypothetical protein KDC67_00225 [Ignavibacteriae bacterium]|nr:hypothetical protein [Ignavibacteriota bacterium]
MSAELRPRVKIISKLSKAEIINRIKKKIEDPNSPCKGWAKGDHALICAPVNERRIWTPQLNLQIDDISEGTEVRGVIGPSSNVWTAFAFTFSILGFIGFVALFWGLSLLSLDSPAEILWVVPITLVLILGVYILARIGQQLSLDQVRELRKFVESTLQD